jgi:hypothetical protein
MIMDISLEEVARRIKVCQYRRSPSSLKTRVDLQKLRHLLDLLERARHRGS